jgi:hypothetical protein
MSEVSGDRLQGGTWMLRRLAGWVICLAVFPAQADARNLTRDFDALEHDFGTLRRGVKQRHSFVFTNNGEELVRIRRVRVSCRCVRASAAALEIPPGAVTTVDAEIDTQLFHGSKSVTIHVQFDKPNRTEVALRVHCVSVDELENRHEIDFGAIPAGVAAQKRMNLDYTGQEGWKIIGIDIANPNVSVESHEVSREAGKVRYELHVVLRESAPAGLLEASITLRTNDPKMSNVPILVQANLQGKVTVSPPELRFESLAPGETVSQTLVIRADRPFRIRRIENAHGIFTVRAAATAKTTQLVVVTVTVPEDLASLPADLELVTDLEDDHVIAVPVRTN